MPVVKLSEEVYRELVVRAGRAQAKEGSKVSPNEIIKRLLNKGE